MPPHRSQDTSRQGSSAVQEGASSVAAFELARAAPSTKPDAPSRAYCTEWTQLAQQHDLVLSTFGPPAAPSSMTRTVTVSGGNSVLPR